MTTRRILLIVLALSLYIGAFFVFPWPVALWVDGALFLFMAFAGDVMAK